MDCATRTTTCSTALMLLLAAVAAVAPLAAHAADSVGTVIAATGNVTAKRDDASARGISRGDAIYEGDTVQTAPRSKAQIRFVDQGLVELDGGSRFGVDEYRGDDGGGSVVMNFLRGALRTITGAISHDSGERYRMKTPTATIGVRGTAYALRYCDADCAQEPDHQQGLYGRVGKGSIEVDNAHGSRVFGENQYFFVARDDAPLRIVAPPDGILDGGGTSRESASGEKITDVRLRPLVRGKGYAANHEGHAGNSLFSPDFEGGDAIDQEQIALALDANSPDDEGMDPLNIAGVAVHGLDENFRFTADEILSDDNSYDTNPNGDVIQADFSAPVDSFDPNPPYSASVANSASLAESGTTLGVDWGRWNGQIDPKANGTTQSQQGNFAFAMADNVTAPANLASVTGTMNYSLQGGPRAFYRGGFQNPDLWDVNALSLGVDFTNQTLGFNQFQLERIDGNQMVNFGSADLASSDLAIDGSGNKVTLQLDNGGDNSADLEGRFIQTDASGIVFVFNVDKGGKNITGTAIVGK